MRHHNPHASSGAAQRRESNRKMGLAKGTTNPFKKDLQGADKQLRKAQREGADTAAIEAAKQKVKDYHERVGLWDFQHKHHAYELTDKVEQELQEAAQQHVDTVSGHV